MAVIPTEEVSWFLTEKLSGIDVSFVDMTAGEDLTHSAEPNHGLPIIIGTEGEGEVVLFRLNLNTILSIVREHFPSINLG
jgi:hypothetical protein